MHDCQVLLLGHTAHHGGRTLQGTLALSMEEKEGGASHDPFPDKPSVTYGLSLKDSSTSDDTMLGTIFR